MIHVKELHFPCSRTQKLKMKSFISLIILLLLCFGNIAAQSKKSPMKKNPKKADKLTAEGYQIITCEVVEKAFINKIGQKGNRKEFYLRRSVQDYYIKFCESELSESEFRAAWERESGFLKTMRLEVEFREGEWDNCEESTGTIQSRIGTYAIVHNIR